MPELRRSTRVASLSASNAPPAKKAKTEQKPKVKKLDSQTSSSELQVGDKIPDLTLLDENEKEVNLSEAAKKTKFLVIFAYPKASTPGCTRQAIGFQKNYEQLQKLDTTVFGLSADKPQSQHNFVTKQGLKYPLLSDPSRELIGLLGAKKSPTGIKRSHWIFVDGVLTIKKVQISPEVSVNSALEDIENLKGENGDEKAENGDDVKDEDKEFDGEAKNAKDEADVEEAKDVVEDEDEEEIKA